jgi:hypothetical protein
MSHAYPGNCGRNATLRQPILIGALVLGVVATRAWGGDLTADEKVFLGQHLSDVVKIESVRVSDPAVIKAFATPFYTVNIDISDGDGGTSHNSVLVTRRDDKLVGVTRPGTDGDHPEIQQMFRPDFRLKNDADARVLQTALDAVFPIIGSSDQKAKTFKQAGHEWRFVRGEFFDAKMGFVVTTDNSGTVTGVKFVLKLP